MSASAEAKLRTLAAQNAALQASLTWPNAQGVNTFAWFDRQLAQGAIAVNTTQAAVTVQRISTQRTPFGNQGGPVQNLSRVRLQINVVSYNAEQARQVAQQIAVFMMTISLLSPGEFQSPQTGPNQNPNCLVNERAGMWPQLQPPAYVETQDWFCFNNENVG